MDEPYTDKNSLISKEEIKADIEANDGFLRLDYLFENVFKMPLKTFRSKFFQTIENLSLEEFIEKMMSYRLESEPFELFEK